MRPPRGDQRRRQREQRHHQGGNHHEGAAREEAQRAADLLNLLAEFGFGEINLVLKELGELR